MAMGFERRRDGWCEVLSSVKVLIFLRLLARRLLHLVFVCWFHLLGATACEVGFDLCHFNAEQAFVQSNLDEDVFMRLPPGCGEMSGELVGLNRRL